METGDASMAAPAAPPSSGAESILFGINRAEQFPDRGAAPGDAHVDLATRREPRQPTPRRGGRRPLQRRWAAFRLPHPPGPDPRPRWTRRDAERPELVARPQRRRRLAARLATRRPEAAAAISDRPNRLDRGMRASPAGPGGTTSCTAATSTGSSSLGITKPSAAVAGDVLVAQLTVRSTGAITAARRLEPGWCHRPGCRRPDRAGALLASRRRLGARRRSRSRGRAATPMPPAGSSPTRASIRSLASTRAAAQRARRRAEARMRPGTHSASPSRPPPRTRCSRRPTESPNGVTVTQSGAPGPRSRVDSVVHGRREGHRRVRRRRPGCSRRLG